MEVEELKNKTELAKKVLDEKQMLQEKEGIEDQKISQDFKTRFEELKNRREKQLVLVEEKYKSLYQRVSGRFQADPVAITVKNFCSMCHMTIPPQLK